MGVTSNGDSLTLPCECDSGRRHRIVTYDEDAEAFFDRPTAITDTALKGPVSSLAESLKDGGLWPLIDAVYPFVGASQGTHSKNLRQTDFDFVEWFPTVRHDRYGVTGGGTNGYARTSTAGALDPCWLYIYCRSTHPTDNSFLAGAGNVGGVNMCFLRRSGNALLGCVHNEDGNEVSLYVPNFAGHLAVTRPGDGLVYVYANGSTASALRVDDSPEAVDMEVLAADDDNPTFTNANIAFMAYGDSPMTIHNLNTLSIAVEEFQLSLGRAI